ncbi:MAG: divergent polysaccharide deacetylase family protein [Desulfuromonadales bacterium]|nr:divergent polysaccharide deacetylase family protein [Desulfuromonadales bacterium]
MLASLFLLAFVGLCLLLLVILRSSYLPEYNRVTESSLPETLPEKQQIYGYQQVYELVKIDLLSGPKSLGWQKLPAEGNLQRLKMFGDYPHRTRLLELSAQVTMTGAPAQLDLLPRKGLVRLYWNKELRLELRYRVPITVSGSRPRIAIIMDDMGRSLNTFHKLLELGLMVTPAILPETRRATEAALMLQDIGREYMIHIPMQPQNYPVANPGPNALLLGQTEREIRRLMRRYMDRVPGAAGGNNHMGSRYTQDRDAMKVVLDELQQGGQFFIDSKTIANSVAYDEARKMGVPTAKRQIFLDNQAEVNYIRMQIRKMVKMSDNRGAVIAICHPYPETMEAFRLELPWLKKQQIDFVSASALVDTD